MKTFLLIASLLVCSTCFCQYRFAGAQSIGKSEWRQYLPVNKDTVELPANIRYIKVDGKVYEIKRSTSIEESRTPSSIWPGQIIFPAQPNIYPTGDTVLTRNWRISTYVGGGKVND